VFGVSRPGGSPLDVLSGSDLEMVHAASLRILEQVGMAFEDAEAVRLLLASGATRQGDRVLLPGQLVEDCLAASPSEFTLYARDPSKDVELGVGRTYFTSGYGATFVIDVGTDEFRQARLDDVRQAAILADVLDMVHVCLLPVIPQDLAGEAGELAGVAILLATTGKHVGPSLSTARLLPAVVDLARLVARDQAKLPISLGCTTSSPLKFSADSIARMRICGQHRIPFRIVSAPLAGTTAPATLAGTLVQQNAEVLGGITLGQLMNPGTPLIYGTFAAASDMRSGKIALGGPELALLNGASAQLAKRYGVPLAYGTGGTCDSPVPDEQAGAERMMTALFAACAGVEVIHDAVGGLLGGAMCFSAVQMAMDNEFCQMIARTMRGIEVNPDTLALDVIAAVGAGGNFLSEMHTVKHYRKEHFLPKLLNRTSVNDWYAGAANEGMMERARGQVSRILSEHHPGAVDLATRGRMQSVLSGVDVAVEL
jgi:trimethylamine---corrinoid protein Co-methyltransferase